MNIVLNPKSCQHSKAVIHYQLHINVPTLFLGPPPPRPTQVSLYLQSKKNLNNHWDLNPWGVLPLDELDKHLLAIAPRAVVQHGEHCMSLGFAFMWVLSVTLSCDSGFNLSISFCSSN